MKRSIIAGILAVVMVTTACPSTGWVSQAIAITDALLPVAVNVLALVGALNGKGVSGEDVLEAAKWQQQVSADLGLLKNELDAYGKLTTVEQGGALAKINDVITQSNTDLAKLLPAMHITNPQTQAKISSIVGLVAAELQSISSLVNLAQGRTTISRNQAKPLTARQFKAAYRQIVKAPTGQADLDAATAALVLK